MMECRLKIPHINPSQLCPPRKLQPSQLSISILCWVGQLEEHSRNLQRRLEAHSIPLVTSLEAVRPFSLPKLSQLEPNLRWILWETSLEVVLWLSQHSLSLLPRMSTHLEISSVEERPRLSLSLRLNQFSPWSISSVEVRLWQLLSPWLHLR